MRAELTGERARERKLGYQVKLFKRGYDGGPDSGVTGYWLIEWKRGFSIVLLHFSPGSREAFHSHAFNAVTLWLKGRITEEPIYLINGNPCGTTVESNVKRWKPGQIKWTSRSRFHRVIAGGQGAWALSIRGPWKDTWQEHKNGRLIKLTSGRVEV